MYQDHFGLYTAPFALSPHLKFVYHSTTFEETMAHLIYGVEGGEEIMLITGEIGTGKTLALKSLGEHISSTYHVALINVTQIDFKELLKLFLSELGVTLVAGADRADLLIALQEHLAGLAREGLRCLLIVDEAQNMDVEILEGVRLLTNMGPADKQVLQVILSGQPGLRSKIDRPELLQLRQRIRVHYHLATLTEKETRAYIDHRLSVAGASRQIFRRDAVARLHALCGGIPRLVNIVADRALLSAYVDGATEVSGRHVEDDDGLVRSPVEETESAERAANAAEDLPLIDHADVEVDEQQDQNGMESKRASLLIVWVLSALAVLLLVVIGWQFGLFDRGEAPEGTAQNLGSGMEPVVQAVPEFRDSTIDSSANAAPDSVHVSTEDSAMAEVAISSVAVSDTLDSVTTELTEPDGGLAMLPVEEDPNPAGVVSIDAQHYVSDYAGLSVHVGSFLEYEGAEILAEQIAALGLDAAFKPVDLDGVTWYRVYAGPYDDLQGAQEGQSLIQSRNISSWMMIVRVR